MTEVNTEPSGDEIAVLLVSGAWAIAGIGVYYNGLKNVAVLGCPRGQRMPLALAPIAGLALVLLVLLKWSATDVRGNPFYIFLFLALGAAWLITAILSFKALGVDLHEDSLEQRNPAAIIATSGGALAVALAYAGGNVGEGPTIYTTIFSSLLASMGLALLWGVLELGSRVSLAVTEERDRASGWRLAGYLVAVGLILGRAVAGDWVSVSDTVRDFVKTGWLAAVLALVAIGVERGLQPRLSRPVPSAGISGVLPAALYVSYAVVVMAGLGRWR